MLISVNVKSLLQLVDGTLTYLLHGFFFCFKWKEIKLPKRCWDQEVPQRTRLEASINLKELKVQRIC